MNAIPARVAGVPDVVAACARPAGSSDIVLAAARIAGVSAVYRSAGRRPSPRWRTHPLHSRRRVIAGPGNAYVTEAKRQVFGVVGIDMLAGRASWRCWPTATRTPLRRGGPASQAEHDEDAYVALVTDSESLPGRGRELSPPGPGPFRAGNPRIIAPGATASWCGRSARRRRRQPSRAGESDRGDPRPLEGGRGDPQRRDRVPGAAQSGCGGRLHRGDQPHPAHGRSGPFRLPPGSCRFPQENQRGIIRSFGPPFRRPPRGAACADRRARRPRGGGPAAHQEEGNGDVEGKPVERTTKETASSSPCAPGGGDVEGRNGVPSSTTCLPCSPDTGCST
jgi:hypothetical protein